MPIALRAVISSIAAPLTAAFATTLTGCRATLPSQLQPLDPTTAIVAVKSCALPASHPFWKSFAHHAWVDLRRPGSTRWERIESGGYIGILHGDIPAEEACLDHRFGERTIRLLGHATGDDAVAAIAYIDARLPVLSPRYATDYTMWPGPNSNTFVRELCAGAPGLSFVFDPNAVGKDHAGLFSIDTTASGTGLRVDTPILGAALALREGVELHLLQLTFGISLDPPGISLPFLPQIPFGFFGAPTARLVPPALPHATVLTLDPTTENGERRPLGTFTEAFTLVFARADQRGYVRIDGLVHDAPAGLRSRDVKLKVEKHEKDGISEYVMHRRSDPRAAPIVERFQCEESVVLLEVQAQSDRSVAFTARAFASTQHEFDVLSREPH